MNNFGATFTEITSWQKNIHYSTGGTRSKYIALHPDTNDEYFFKGSKETPNGEIRYPTEFWSEIVASKIGQFLGFEMLDYNIAFDKNHKQQIGCLSKSMIVHSENKLTEGVAYLTGYDAKYNPENDKNKYTFQFIRKALIDFKFEKYVDKLIEIIIFDSIIGNSDRHQENWGIILFYKSAVDNLNEELQLETLNIFSKIKKYFAKIINESAISQHRDNIKIKPSRLLLHSEITPHKFAPIYDSGCCLGREFEGVNVHKMINDKQMIESYVNKGKSEIHWENLNRKLPHFELVSLLIDNDPYNTKAFISKVKNKFDENFIKQIIQDIDLHIPEELINFKLSHSRKELMFKLVTLRIEKLLNLV